MGVPTISLVTEQFQGLGAAAAKGRRMPNLPITVMPHGYDQWDEQAIKDEARLRLPEIMAALTGRTKS